MPPTSRWFQWIVPVVSFINSFLWIFMVFLKIQFSKFSILQILSKFDTVPFCIISYFDHFRHFRILLEFWNFLLVPLVLLLGLVRHVISIAHSKKVIRTLIFSRFVHVFIYQNYFDDILGMSKFWFFL